MDYTEIDLSGLCVSGVDVSSWCHSGPVSVDLKGVWLEHLIEKINETGKDGGPAQWEKRLKTATSACKKLADD